MHTPDEAPELSRSEYATTIRQCAECGNEFETTIPYIETALINREPLICSDRCRKAYELREECASDAADDHDHPETEMP